MQLPILDKLKDGVKFDFDTLTDNFERAEEFWSWWWNDRERTNEICRPETISDEDPILIETINKPTVNLCKNRQFFDRHLFKMTEKGVFPIAESLDRESFRRQAMSIVANAGVALSRPEIVFSGGGYGSGKTTALNLLSQKQFLPIGPSSLVGVDVFKPLIPEYGLIKAVSDGRASLTVQKECVTMASQLFKILTGNRRSFVWDSSMSDKDETIKRIQMAKSGGYRLTMVAVLTPLKLAIKQAMRRAFQSRRFPNPDALPKSHVKFREYFNDYIGLFDAIFVIAKETESSDTILVAGKTDETKDFEIVKPDLFTRLMETA